MLWYVVLRQGGKMKKLVLILLVIAISALSFGCGTTEVEGKWESDDGSVWEFEDDDFRINGEIWGTFKVSEDEVTISFTDDTEAIFTFSISDDILTMTTGGLERNFKRK